MERFIKGFLVSVVALFIFATIYSLFGMSYYLPADVTDIFLRYSPLTLITGLLYGLASK